MAMNPRLLRPRASGFSPKSIAGLQVWLDGSDSSTFTMNGSTVSEWRDKSGNSRHFSQATALRQPAVTAAAKSGKSAVAFTDDWMAGSYTYSIGSIFVVWEHPTTIGAADYYPAMVSTRTVNSIKVANGSMNFGLMVPNLVNNVAVDPSPSGASYILNGFTPGAGFNLYNAGVPAQTSPDRWQQISATFTPVAGSKPIVIGADAFGGFSDRVMKNGHIAELLIYSAALTAEEVAAVNRYLSGKWGITLAPQVSNADAQDWVNRVYTNGGTASASTASAVNTFCNAIDAAGIRDRFYRLNLFCGTGLNAALVPLYCGQSRTGTQYGNTTDTNNGPFVSGDYAETGATGGLKGNASSKYLNTGVKASALPTAATGHLSVWGRGQTGTRAGWLVAFGAAYASPFEIEYNNNDGNTFRGWGREVILGTTPGSVKHLLVSRQSATSQTHYNDGALVNTETFSTTPTATSADLCCFCRNVNGTQEAFSNVRMNAYSIGLSMTAAQVTSFYTALNTFLATLGRT